MTLPADGHVHSEWSWDTGGPRSGAAGRMRAICARAVAIGLPAVFFTEHLDIPGTWHAAPEDLLPHQQDFLNSAGRVDFAPFDADGYFDAIDRMRHDFPSLRIHTGIEFGQPHLFASEAARLVDFDLLDRVLGSLHTVDLGDGRAEPHTLFRKHEPAVVLHAYLAEVPTMVQASEAFEVFTHIDYATRLWPGGSAGPFDPRAFEEAFRTAMRSIAQGGRALEINTALFRPWIAQWWAEEGGQTVSIGSDAHTADALARDFPEATATLERFGFRPGRTPEDLWARPRFV